MNPLQLAGIFHGTYERLAPQFGYETRPDTREFRPASPNGQLMIAVCQELLDKSVAEKPTKPAGACDYCDNQELKSVYTSPNVTFKVCADCGCGVLEIGPDWGIDDLTTDKE
jgi:hypothetical protein